MEHEPPRDPPPAPFAPAAPLTPDRAHWTPAKQRLFLHALLDTGSVAHAARAAGMSRSSAHRLRQRLAGTLFDLTWRQVLLLHAEQLADPFGTNAASSPPHAHAPAARVSPHRRAGAPTRRARVASVSRRCRVPGASPVGGGATRS